MSDEINRAPAKVDALLDNAREAGDHRRLSAEAPFLVMATQNPIDQEGPTLPEAQVDRFMMLVKVDYPTKEEERLIIDSSFRQLSPRLM